MGGHAVHKIHPYSQEGITCQQSQTGKSSNYKLRNRENVFGSSDNGDSDKNRSTLIDHPKNDTSLTYHLHSSPKETQLF